MNKKSLLIVLIVMIAAFGLFADDSPFGSHYNDSNLMARLAVGTNGSSFAVYPGVEYIFTQVDFANGVFPVDFGGLLEGYLGYGNSQLGLGAAAYVTAHLGLAKIDVEFVENLDIFFGIGFGFLGSPTLTGISGISYFFDPNTSIFVEYNYFASSSGCLGIQFLL